MFLRLLPCGRCIGCRLERSRQWAVRMVHEASLYPQNCVVTLTYGDAHLPVDGSLDRRAFPLFIRRLRKRGATVRYFHCGEYGEREGRPHYHGCLFGFDFADKVVGPLSQSGAEQWESEFLRELWPFGVSRIGTLNFESAAYIARYVTKKVTGKLAAAHYERVNPLTGELVQVEPEFATMSRRPGIGKGWLEKYSSDVYPSDEVIVRGRECKPPRFYDKQLSEEELRPIKAARVRGSVGRMRNGSSEQLQVREVCAEGRLSLSPRRIE